MKCGLVQNIVDERSVIFLLVKDEFTKFKISFFIYNFGGGLVQIESYMVSEINVTTKYTVI